MEIKNNEELKSMINNGVINCNGEDLICNFDINVDADIINARNIIAWNITAINIDANNIIAEDINAGDITAKNINAFDINAFDINADNIYAADINSRDINAHYILYYGVCFAYENITCNSIKGRRENSKHFVLDGKIEIKNGSNE